MFKTFSYKGSEVQRLKNVIIINPCIIWIVSGIKKIFISGNEYKLQQGEAIFLYANTKLTFENIPQNGLFFSKQINFIKPPNSDLLKENKNEQDILRSVKLDNKLEMALDFFYKSDSIIKNVKVRHTWLDGLYLLLAEENYLNILFKTHKTDFSEKVYDALEKIEPKEHKIENICLYLGVSKATLIRRLKKTGTQFKKIVRQVRMNKALYLFQKGNYDLNEVSCFCGYHSVELFNLYFEEEFGVSPKKYLITME